MDDREKQETAWEKGERHAIFTFHMVAMLSCPVAVVAWIWLFKNNPHIRGELALLGIAAIFGYILYVLITLPGKPDKKE